jgi:hypothetical protein
MTYLGLSYILLYNVNSTEKGKHTIYGISKMSQNVKRTKCPATLDFTRTLPGLYQEKMACVHRLNEAEL